MKSQKSKWIFILFLFTQLSVLGQNHIDFLPDNRKMYILADQNLMKVEGNTTQPIKEFKDEIYKAILKDKELWLACKSGLKIFSWPDLSLKKSLFENENVSDLTLANDGKFWVAVQNKGIFAQNSTGDFETKLEIPVNYAIEATPDNHIYAGTNLGLYKINLSTQFVKRFAEEAHSGLGLPDNLVLDIFVDNSSNVWVLMPDHLAFIKGDDSLAEFPTFSYVGNKSNQVKQILGIDENNYLFLTDLGVILLPGEELVEHGHGEEIFNAHQTPSLAITNQQLNAPKQLLDKKILAMHLQGKWLWFYTQHGVWKTNKQKVHKLLKKLKLAKADH